MKEEKENQKKKQFNGDLKLSVTRRQILLNTRKRKQDEKSLYISFIDIVRGICCHPKARFWLLMHPRVN